MDVSGEASIRITQVLEESGTVRGSLYHHFGGRENLVKQAVVERYIRSVTKDFEVFAAGLAKAETTEDLIFLVDTELYRLGGSDAQEQRRRRMSALGSAAYRPDILAEIGRMQNEFVDVARLVMIPLQEKGLVNEDLEAKPFAIWLLGLLLSRFLSDINPDRDTEAAWASYTRSAVFHLLGLSELAKKPSTEVVR
jgi:hypothetical protein